jgi:hypothetical protein
MALWPVGSMTRDPAILSRVATDLPVVRKRRVKIAETLSKEDAGCNQVRRIGTYTLSAGASDAPHRSCRNQYLMQVIPIDLAFEVDARNVESRSSGNAPIPASPPTVHSDPELRSQKAKERPTERAFGDVAVAYFRWMFESRIEWDDCFVGNGRIIECQSARKKPVARNAMGISCVNAA